ncbi:sensor histidine kinase [Clostridium luticellarii]|jgi:signal transduction histidine kinase|uniref:histidine kinase n=1 Tax=Clostridium luticellarii TaxID=1691940 RepID=A0A2T0BP48_9CLOT|nr:HAMP domain-containing sensor histidine kinase [Clostridium luticellarii]MCI1944601.1 HAMP domain-containing histidine kinase [Clostridium luticellarii]MCI1968100.1 HAMP domain-containing histidine kinase [Clostridium luticellarii]MCI1994787.1 HAMP domain-containing histidine kinase [Clostridium luticellarii]MCI2039019.1 HAMP domain-containing histidine kinase [Clostridium luticellarii]PRR85605.1 Sensor histidine kinase YycG [Clostridium luticellarii]
MKKGLFSKLMAAFIAIIIVSFVMTAAFLSYWFEGYYFKQRESELLKESQFIKYKAIQYLDGNLTKDDINDTLTYIGNYLSADIWLVDNYGYVYSVSKSEHKKLIATSKQIVTSDLKELRENETVDKIENYSEIFTDPVHTFEVPIFSDKVFKGAIMMHTSINELKEPLKWVYKIIWASAVFAIVICCIVIYYLSQKIIIRPLERINYAADKISRGEVEKRVEIRSNDEIGELAKSFNSMADSLQKVEKNRREFISNVSHEIRSPITSIKGFIGGMIDGVIPLEKQNYYLTVTYSEIQRLTRLVNDLLDLSTIESGQLKLNIEKVDINEIIRLCVIKFETRINEKKLKVDVHLEDDKLYVAADKDRITQVVTNLVDNAVKYVNENGNIKIFTKIKGEKVFTSIYNDGSSISQSDMKYIWDRFYKMDKSRTSKISTGLGLPIVRSILTQLGEDIWAENKKPDGIMFTFTLKRV